MDRLESNMYKTMLAQAEAEYRDNENLSDLPEHTNSCTGDVCGFSWTPKKTENKEEKE